MKNNKEISLTDLPDLARDAASRIKTGTKRSLAAVKQATKGKKKPAPKNLPAKTNATRGVAAATHKHHSAAHKVVNTLTKLITESLRLFILWGLFSTIIFCVGAYFVYTYAAASGDYPGWYKAILGIVVFGVYSLFGLSFGLLMAALYTAKAFAGSMGNIIMQSLGAVKTTVESKMDAVKKASSHNDIMDIISSVFTDISQNIKQYATRTIAGIAAVMMVTGLLFAAKNMLAGSMSKFKTRAEYIAALSAKAALAAAVVLNLKLFAKLAIAALCLVGIIALLSQALIILWVK